MRKKQLFDGLIALAALAAFVVCFLGASMLTADDNRGWIMCGVALGIAIPVVILANREEKA